MSAPLHIVPVVEVDLDASPEEQEQQLRRGLAALPHITGNERTAKFQHRDDLRDLAARLVKRFPERLSQVFPTQIAFLVNTEDKPVNKGKATLAKTIRLSAREEFLSGYTHVMEFYTRHTADLTDNQLTLLLYAELLHIGEDGQLQAHDIEEFAEVVTTFGLTVFAYRREHMPDILDEEFDWAGIRQPTLFDAAGEQP